MLNIVITWYVVGLVLSVIINILDVFDRRRHYDVIVTVGDVVGILITGFMGPILIFMLLESRQLDLIIRVLNKFELFKLDKKKEE